MRSQTTLSGASSKSTLAPMTHEHPSHQRPEHNEPDYPAALPPELAEFLKKHDYACITQATDQQQHTDYAALATQQALALLFMALQTIPADQRDFDAAKAAVMQATQL